MNCELVSCTKMVVSIMIPIIALHGDLSKRNVKSILPNMGS